MHQQHFNWLAGRWVGTEQGRTFEAAGGTWPRSGTPELRAAFASLGREGDAWAALQRQDRHALLVDARARLRSDRHLARELGRELGLVGDEADSHLEEDLFQLDQALEILRDGGESGPTGVGVFRAHWSDRVGRLAARSALRLVAGHSVVLIADPLLPRAAEAWVRALADAGLPAGALALLHEDTGELLEQAIGDPAAAWLRIAGHAEELARVAERAPPRLRKAGSFWPLRNRTAVVLAADDPARAAEDTVLDAFGRRTSLSGQLPGHTARVVCHQRVFSRFTQSLLDRVEGDPDVAQPVPAIEEGALEHLRSSWELGLDEGATPIYGGRPGDPEPTPAETPQSGAQGKPFGAGIPPRYLEVRRARRATPLIFTNVEPRQRLARLARPEPVLRLIRAPSDEAARELAELFDRAHPEHPGPWKRPQTPEPD